MNWLIYFIFWLVGMFISSFTIIPILIILAFGIPTTERLERANLLKENHGIIKGYYISMILLATIFIVVYWVTKTFFPTGMVGLLIGAGMTLIFGFGQVGRNKNNASDYIQTNARHFKGTEQEVANAMFAP